MLYYEQMSDEKIIRDGQKQLESLQKNLYLHNIKDNYEAIGGEFSPVDLSIMDKIGDKIVQEQQAREQQIYSILRVKNVNELNKKYMEMGGNSEFISANIKEILEKASIDALGDLEGIRAIKQNRNAVADAFETIINNMAKENYEDEEIATQIADGISLEYAQRLANMGNKKGKAKTMDNYIKTASKAIKSNLAGDMLEKEIEAVCQKLVDEINGISRCTAKMKNAYGKQIKADDTITFLDEHLDIGISAKNYKTINKAGDVEVSLHSEQTLENFYKLVSEMQANGASARDIKGISKIINSFKTPYFKYHLINEAVFSGMKKSKTGGAHIEETRSGKNIIDFVKMCLPLFIGSQMKIKGDSINVDFMNINGKFIPVSTILKSVFDNSLGSLRIGLYSNYNIPWWEMIHKKQEYKVDDNMTYYSSGAQKAGGYYGKQVYKNIKIGTVHLRLALAKF